jgi:hypothetical protein
MTGNPGSRDKTAGGSDIAPVSDFYRSLIIQTSRRYAVRKKLRLPARNDGIVAKSNIARGINKMASAHGTVFAEFECSFSCSRDPVFKINAGTAAHIQTTEPPDYVEMADINIVSQHYMICLDNGKADMTMPADIPPHAAENPNFSLAWKKYKKNAHPKKHTFIHFGIIKSHEFLLQ